MLTDADVQAIRQVVDRASAVGLVTQTVTTTYAMTSADRVIRADATAGTFTVTLPTALSVVGALLILVKVDTGANAVTIAVQSPDTIGPSAATSLSLAVAGQVVMLRAWRNGDSVKWDLVNAPAASALLGTSLPSTITGSALTSVGTLTALTVSPGTTSVQALTATTGVLSGSLTLDTNGSFYQLRRTTGAALVSVLGIDTGTDDLTIRIPFANLRVRDTGAGVPLLLTATGQATFAGALTVTAGGITATGQTITATTFAGNASTATTATSATTAGTVTTAAQPAITSVGTLTSLTVSGASSLAWAPTPLRLTADNTAIAAATPTTGVAVTTLQQAVNVGEEWDIEWILHVANSIATDVFVVNVAPTAGTFTGRVKVLGQNGVPTAGAGVAKQLDGPAGTITTATANAPGNTGTIGLVTTIVVRAQGKQTVSNGTLTVQLRAGTSAAVSSGTATVKTQSQMIATRLA